MQDTEDTQPIRRRFTRRVVKKDPVQSDIKVVTIQRKAAGGGGGGPELEPFCGAGGGEDWWARRGAGYSRALPDANWPLTGAGYCAPPVTMDSERQYVRAKAPTPLETLRALKVKALVTLDAARALASDAFMKAATAKNGTDYNRYMDESAVAGTEVQRLYNIVDDIEVRIMAMEIPGLFVA